MRNWFYLLLFVNLSGSVFSQQSLTISADSSRILIGNLLEVQVTLKTSKPLSVKFPELKDSIGALEIVKSVKPDTAFLKNECIVSQKFLVSVYDSGDYNAGPLVIRISDKDSVVSNTFSVRAETVNVDTTADFKDIKPVLEVPLTFKELLPTIGIGLLILAIVCLLIYFIFFRKNHKPKVQERFKPKDPAHVWARAELRKLEEEKLLNKGEFKAYHSKLSDIIRLYLEYRYNYYAMEATTEQIEEEVKNLNMPLMAERSLMEILKRSDLVKFANMHLPMEAHVLSIKQAYEFVEMTKLIEQVQSNPDKK